ncbi:rod shape-determining protein [Planctomycetota bacterium]
MANEKNVAVAVKPKKDKDSLLRTERDKGQKNVILVGMDLGTNTSVMQGWHNNKELQMESDIIPTVVGLPREGVLPGIIPSGKDRVYGNEALNLKLHCDLKWPIKLGYVENEEYAHELIGHVRDVINPEQDKEIWAVVGSPANAKQDRLRELRKIFVGHFQRILIVPEPFLAAMGYRDEDRLSDPAYTDPIRNSLFVDIGAGTTDLCMVQGVYPTADDQISLGMAGNDIDKTLKQGIRKRYPDAKITPTTITRLKEQFSYVGNSMKDCVARVAVRGKMKTIDITSQVKEACSILIDPIIQNAEALAARCDADAVEEMMTNLILTGGGSLIKNLKIELEKELRALGYESAKVHVVEDYKRLVAKGALKTAKAVRVDQWSMLM